MKGYEDALMIAARYNDEATDAYMMYERCKDDDYWKMRFMEASDEERTAIDVISELFGKDNINVFMDMIEMVVNR